MNMVCLLLQFIRAQRDGLWELHLYAFQQMLPFFHRYYHTNYARWGCVYLAEMNQLPIEVKEEFLKGNFVLKGSDQTFNQVDPDHSQEWLNGIEEKGWWYHGNYKNHISIESIGRCHITSGPVLQPRQGHCSWLDQMVHNETTPARMKRDNDDEDKIV